MRIRLSFAEGSEISRGKVRCVIGADVDAAVLMNESVDEALVIPSDGSLALETASIDIVVCDAVFEHVSEPRKFVAELDRIVKPGGWVSARPLTGGDILRLVPVWYRITFTALP